MWQIKAKQYTNTEKGVSFMIDFLKRNVKTVVISSVALVIIAGLSTALVLTNIGHGNRGKDRDRRPDRIMLMHDQRVEKSERVFDRLEQKLADGAITQEEYNEKLEKIENSEYRVSGRSAKGQKNKDTANTD